MGAEFADVIAAEQDAAVVDVEEPADQPQQRSLPGPGRADDRGEAAIRNYRVNAFDDRFAFAVTETHAP